MGMDKEATDIWAFGKPRPDLTPEQTFTEAREAVASGALAALDSDEKARREALVSEIVNRRTRDMATGVEIGMRAAKAKAKS